MPHFANIIFTNARVFSSDESNRHAEAVAVKTNRIVYAGSNKGTGERRGDKTRVIDAQGHSLTPGFIDSHFHLLWGSTWMAAHSYIR